jgi:hypothetical protein
MAGYKVPDWKKSIGQNMYDVEVGDKTFTIPRAEYLSAEHVELMSRTGELGSTFVLNTICPGLGDAFAPVPVKFVNEFIAAWQKDSSIDLGESEASAD